MEKLILIDGNSLLNRAFYAMGVFSTQDGLPTNGIFGFTKLIFKIIEEEKPKYFAVTFDLHAPTFRHKMYDGYKATRKSMPEELVRQVPVLKDLLRTMQICILEKEGYEADDVIGTVSRRFNDVEVLIYTGDRDSYQLVRENVSICFTKRGVSDLDRITAQNFKDVVGLEPYQIIEEKALMGDSSDNIPGVRGIGSKTAFDLLLKYRTVDGVYEHLDELSASLRRKLEEGGDGSAFKTLATIDTNVPIEFALEDARLLPSFPPETRDMFARLEFRILQNSNLLSEERKNTGVPTETVTDLGGFLQSIEGVTEYSVSIGKRACHIFFGQKEYILPYRETLLSDGFFPEELYPVYASLFSGKRRGVSSDVKALSHKMAELGLTLPQNMQDVSLMRYLLDSNVRTNDETEFTTVYALPDDNRAYSIWVAFTEAEKKLAGTTEEKLYREIERPLADVLIDMEREGISVDDTKFNEFSEKFGKELQSLSAEIFALAGVESFNLNSPFKLSEILFNKLGFESKGIKKMRGAVFSTSAEVLEKLAEEHEIAGKILRYREVQKLLSTYVDGIRPLVRKGVVHTTYHQTMTTTGRLSSANPNLQNIPVRTEEGRELRKLFVAREGNVLVDADYSQIELRLLAHCSGCKALTEAYRNGEDIHSATAARVFGVPLSEVTPAMRRRAKTINFGIIYGMSAFGLAKDIGCSANEAREFIEKYFSLHPEVKEFMDENVRRAKEDGFVTTILGRKRFIPELQSSNYMTRSFGERAAMNMPLQGSAADIIKLAMLRVSERLKQENFRSKLILQVHDELVLDTPVEEAERAKKMLKNEMEAAFSLNVPLVSEVSTGRSWYDAK